MNLNKIMPFTFYWRKYTQKSAFKFVQCSKMANDVQNAQKQLQIIEYHHIYKSEDKVININELKKSLFSTNHWPKMGQIVENFMNNCKTCLKNC